MPEGHGHVYPLPGGLKARCGGPGICPQCSGEMADKLVNERVEATIETKMPNRDYSPETPEDAEERREDVLFPLGENP